MGKNLKITKPHYSEHILPVSVGPSLYQGFIVYVTHLIQPTRSIYNFLCLLMLIIHLLWPRSQCPKILT